MNKTSIDDAAIKAYLQDNPNFFENHPDLLELIQLPHESGRAVSLVERQVAVLRERNMEMRQRLNNLLEAARTNDKLFEKTKRLVLNLLDSRDINSLVDTLYESLGNDYQLQYFSLVLLTDTTRLPDNPARVVGLEEAENQVGTLLRSNRAICGVLRQEELQFLFGNKAGEIGSVAAVPLTRGQSYGILAIGNSDPNYYRSSMGTLFLSYIAEVLNRILPKFIK
ncbi:DUF484 family protein [Porticoccus sp. W117]|nr:DUF484 family protein [Porticoccus sp. W117]MDM3870947.1 DUF484 family protein [Porticoccus sp. W117]